MVSTEHYGLVDQDGKLSLINPTRFKVCLKEFIGKEVCLSLNIKKNKRTLNQNSLLWSVVYADALRGFRDVGNEDIDLETVHEFFKNRFLSKKEIVSSIYGELDFVGASTKHLSKEEFSNYIESIDKFCIEFLNIKIRI